MTVEELIEKLQRIVKERPNYANYEVDKCTTCIKINTVCIQDGRVYLTSAHANATCNKF